MTRRTALVSSRGSSGLSVHGAGIAYASDPPSLTFPSFVGSMHVPVGHVPWTHSVAVSHVVRH